MVKSPSTNRDSFLLVSANLTVAILGVISQYLVLVSLETIEYGFWVLLLDATLTIGILVDFGIPDAMIRLWNGSREDVNRVVARGLSGQSMIATVLIALSIPISLYFDFEYTNSFSLVLMVIGSILLYQLGSLRIGLRMLGRADEESIALVVDRILFIIALYISIRIGPNINNLSIAFVSAAIFSFSYTAWRYLENREPPSKSPNEGASGIFEGAIPIIISASPFAISLFMFPLFGRVDKFIIAWSGGIEEVAYFNIPWLVILSGLAVPRSIRQAALPDLRSKKADVNKKFEIMRNSWPISSLLIWVGVPASLVVSKLVFENIFPSRLVAPSDESFSGIRLMICLLPAWVWAMIGALELELLKLEKSPIKYSLIIGFALFVNLIIGLILIPEFGLLGAAISSTIGFLSLFAISFISGPFFDSMFSGLFFQKSAHGIYYSSILLVFAIHFDSKSINDAFYSSLAILMILTFPIMIWGCSKPIKEYFRN